MGLEHVETIVANNQSTVDFTNVFDDSANRYRIFMDNVISDTDQVALQAKFSSDGGSTWDSGTSDYAWSEGSVGQGGSSNANGSSGDSQITRIGNFCGNSPSSNDTNHFSTTVHDPADVDRATVCRSKGTRHVDSLGSFFLSYFAGGQRLTQSAVDSIQFFTSSGNISSGIFSVYKVTQSTGGAKQHIETIEADNQSSVDFTDVFQSDDGYDRYQIYIDNIIGSDGDRRFLECRMSSDAGSTWDSGESDYAESGFFVHDGGDTTTSGSSSTESITVSVAQIIGTKPNDNDTSMFNILISNPTNTKRATVLRASSSVRSDVVDNPFRAQYSGGIRLTQSAIDSIQFFMDSGNIASGTFSVYGIGE